MKAARWMVLISLWVGALLHMAPLLAISGTGAVKRLYGVSPSDPNVLLLLQHRALLFGLLGGLMLLAIRQPALRLAALSAGWISMLGFILLHGLAFDANQLNAQVLQVRRVDLLALPLVVLGWLAQAWLAWSARLRQPGMITGKPASASTMPGAEAGALGDKYRAVLGQAPLQT